jgi:hypothetical protein
MNVELYRRYLEQYVRDALANSSGTNTGVFEYLSSIRIGKHFVAHKEEKERALKDARIAFDEHRHWPLNIVLSHLGIDTDIAKSKP